jgi:uncharacterized membrane protein
VALYISFFFDIAVARQIIGFLYITFLPGFVILRLLKQNNLGLAEVVLFSLGLSLGFMELGGLVLNEASVLFGFGKPLDPSLLVLVLSGFVLLGAFASYFRGSQDFQLVGLTKSNIVRFFVLCLIPVISVMGTYFANITGNTSLLILNLLVVLIVFVLTVFSKRLIPPNLHLVVVFIIAITLLFQFSLISNYSQGGDIKIEYYVANLTKDAGFWNSTASFMDAGSDRYYSMLSITILPTMYSNILNMDITWVFKIVYPLLFAFVPLALYLLFRGKFGATVAFLSVFLFMSQTTFYTEMLSLTRQIIAEVFYVLLFLVVFSKSLSSRNVKILFFIFGFCLTVSHYSIAMIFAFSITLMWLFRYFSKKPNKRLNLGMVVIFLVSMILWFVAVSSSTLTVIAIDTRGIISGFSDFFNPAFRGTTVMSGIGLAQASGPLYSVSRYIAYLTEFFIIIGFLALFLQRKKKDFDIEYFTLGLINLIILAMCIVLPNLAQTFNIERFYHVVLFILAPLFAIGCFGLFRFAAKLLRVGATRKIEICSVILITLILGSYFLFQTNIIYETTGEKSWSFSLSRYRLGSRLFTDFSYVTAPQVSSSKWVSQNINQPNLVIYADQTVAGNLLAYSQIDFIKIHYLANIEILQPGQFIYLGELNTLYGKLLLYNLMYNMSDALGSQPLNVIYNNGPSEILLSPINPR